MISREQIEKEITDRLNQLHGLNVLEFLKSQYSTRLRMSSGSQYVFEVTKCAENHSYTVRFQLVRLSCFGYSNQYRAASCTCPRFGKQRNCHHILLTCAEHAASINQDFNLEIFANFELSKVNVSKMQKAA